VPATPVASSPPVSMASRWRRRWRQPWPRLALSAARKNGYPYFVIAPAKPGATQYLFKLRSEHDCLCPTLKSYSDSSCQRRQCSGCCRWESPGMSGISRLPVEAQFVLVTARFVPDLPLPNCSMSLGPRNFEPSTDK
jgi:hypothetical protein